MNPQHQELMDAVQYTFRQPALMLEALTHPSYTAENADCVVDYQRLEFLGDAVIQIAITQMIYAQFPTLPEGRLTKIRAALTRAHSLAAFARELGLGRHLRLGRGERQNRGSERVSTLCDTFEAMMGAIYIDNAQDLEPVSLLLKRMIENMYVDLEAVADADNPKGALQEWTQQHLQTNPEYQLAETSGPDHERSYTVRVLVDEECYGTGTARRRQSAETEAARVALAKLRSS